MTGVELVTGTDTEELMGVVVVAMVTTLLDEVETITSLPVTQKCT